MHTYNSYTYTHIHCCPPASDYKEFHTDTTVRFVVYLTADKMAEAQKLGYHKKFKLETHLNTSNLVHPHIPYMYTYSTYSVDMYMCRYCLTMMVV